MSRIKSLISNTRTHTSPTFIHNNYRHFCSVCGKKDKDCFKEEEEAEKDVQDTKEPSILLKRPRKYVYNPYARFDQTENYRGKVSNVNFISNIIINDGNNNSNNDNDADNNNNNNNSNDQNKSTIANGSSNQDDKNLSSNINNSTRTMTINELGGIPVNKKIYFWYSTLSPCSFCSKCIDSQTMCDLMHITEIGENLFEKPVQFFVPDMLQKSSSIIRLNLIFERVLFFLTGNSLAQPFLQPLLLALPEETRSEFSKLLGPHNSKNAHLSYIAEKVRCCKYRSVTEFLDDWNRIRDSCAILCNGKYAPSASSLLDAAKTILHICAGQLKAHTKDIQILQRNMVEETTADNNNNKTILRSQRCFPVLTPENISNSNDVFIPTFENGWTIKSWSKYIEKGENYYGLPLEPPVVDEIVVVDEIDESFADGINNEKEPSSSLSSIMTMDKVSSSQPPPKKKAKVVKQTTKNAATTTTATSTTTTTTTATTKNMAVNKIQTEEEVDIANVLNNINEINDDRDIKDVVTINDNPDEFDLSSILEGNNSSSRSEFRLLPDPVEQIRSLVQTQNHHMRSALLAAKELESAWFATQQMYSSGGSSSNTSIDGNNSIISIGDGNLIAEYRLANSNLKVMISKLRKQLRQETIRRKEMEAEVFKLRQKLSLDI